MLKKVKNSSVKTLLIALTCTFSACDSVEKKTEPTPQPITKTDTPQIDVEKKTEPQTKTEGSKMETLPSGLQYTTLKPGTSDQKPTPGKQVTVHYTGWLWNNGEKGQKFDSSVDRGEPFTFMIGVGMVIKGWDEGVMGMKIGEKRQLVIPPQLAYGSRGAGSVIKPNSTLMFEVELISVS